MLRRARESTAASATATKALIKTLQDVTQTTKRNDRDLNAGAPQARARHRSLPLKFDGLVPGAHVASGRYATLPSSLKSPAASPRARQPGKIAESVRRHNWFRPVLKKIGDATKTGPLPRCMLKFLGTAHRCIANGDEIDGDVFFQICALAFRGDDWKLPILSSVVPIVCDALSISHDALLAWFKRNGRRRRRRRSSAGWPPRRPRPPRATHNARRGRGGAKAKGQALRRAQRAQRGRRAGSENGGGGILEEDEDEDGRVRRLPSRRASIKRGASS
ncbi:hypothetical protein SO694_00016146 [Aureococcus anophagefferens]|uniref:Uncharacterized protein n=1 Tax=Aureococcus anophagefferens TaxID=44056 RepID=A0ABR1G1S8_AURAN